MYLREKYSLTAVSPTLALQRWVLRAKRRHYPDWSLSYTPSDFDIRSKTYIIKQNLKCGKATARTGADFSGTKSCGFSERKKKGQERHSSILKCFSVWESSCSQEVNVKGSLVPSGKGQLLHPKKTPPKIRMQCLLLHFSPVLCLWLERLLSLKHRNRQLLRPISA